MADIQIKEVSSLSLEEIHKHLLPSCKISSLEKLKLGKQKKDTVVIGEYCEIQRRKPHIPGRQQALRFKLKEVLPENHYGLGFEVLIFGKTVNLIEDALKSKESSSFWIGFSNLLVVNYTGQQEPWSPYGLKIEDDEENDSDLKQEVIFFYHRIKQKELSYKYATLNDTKDKSRLNVFVVVTSIIKQPVVLGNKTKHIMLGLIDPSCLEKSAAYQDIPLHIFLNDKQDCFPQPFEAGDILRIREMLGDLFFKEKKMFGKIFHSKSVVKFKLREDDDKVTPISSNSSYVLTAQDEKKVRELRQWWIKHMKEQADGIYATDSLLLEKELCEVTTPCTFNLNCVIKDVRVVETHNIVVLRVTDGTKSMVPITTVNFNDATLEFSSQEEQMSSAALGSKEVDITVFEPLIEKASSLKEGDMVQLINVSSVDIVNDEDNLRHPVLDIYMKDEKCEIREVLEHTSISRKLLRSLSGRSPSVKDCEVMPLTSVVRESHENLSSKRGEESVSSSLLHQVPQNFIPLSSSSPTKSVDMTVIEEVPSPPSSPSLLVNENGKDYEKNGPYPVLLEQVDLMNSVNGEVTEFHNHKRNCNDSGNSKGKRKLCKEQLYICEPRSKISCYEWQNKEIDTICKTYDKMSLTDFCKKSRPDEQGRVWAILKQIRISTRKICDRCPYINCYHDWVWGLCVQCGTTLSSKDLRDNFSVDDLITCKTLPCTLCSSSSPNSVAKVEPFFKLHLYLEDVNNDNCFTVDLCGDHAELFLGVEATFIWTVESVPITFHNRINMFQRLNSRRPFQYCLINRSKSDGSHCFQICDTRLNF